MPGPKVVLTPAESLFQRFLLDCRKQYSPDLEIRFTGGWVRDKLLHVQSHDIDVALSTMTGSQFAQILRKFIDDGKAASYEEEANALQLKAPLGSIHQIAANPEKSKHLETVATRMFGFDVDLVNLRKEVYAEDSRNPQMEFGTAEEDALRRDATINALFYNLQTEQVEDFTGKGLDDMQGKIIRTPLAPYQTFRDDPLRILRLIRFASRFDYEIEAGSMEAMRDKTIHEALRAKISRERVGIEVDKMFTGPDPYKAVKLIYDLDLHTTVFADPFSKKEVNVSKLPMVYDSLLLLDTKFNSSIHQLNLQANPALSWYLAAYTPWKTSEAAAVEASKDGIKASRKLMKIIGDSVRHVDAVSEMLQDVGSPSCSRSQLAMFVRRLGPSWRSHIFYAMLCEFGGQSFGKVIERYQALLDAIERQDLLFAAETVPILKGNKIQEAMGVNGGPWLTKATNMVVEWQFDNPGGSEEAALEMIRGRKADLGLG
jgi:tRNA nucleotidyltransferase (CCA-adding enzyme)